jgi:hypothetical protein
MNLNGNFAWVPSVSNWNIGNDSDVEDEMENAEDNEATDIAQRFRDYAAECRRLAQRAPEKDRKVLMEIADAWISCAEDTERRKPSNKKGKGS